MHNGALITSWNISSTYKNIPTENVSKQLPYLEPTILLKIILQNLDFIFKNTIFEKREFFGKPFLKILP